MGTYSLCTYLYFMALYPWDDASHYNHSIFSLFTIAVLDEQGHDVCLRLDSQIWCPDTQFYDAGICNSRRALELKRE